MKPYRLVFLFLRLSVWDAMIRWFVAKALRCSGTARVAWLRDARIYGHFLRNGIATCAEQMIFLRDWLNARKQSALEVMG